MGMDIDAAKRNVRRMFDEAFGKGRLDVVDECVAPGAVDHHELAGEADFAGAIKGVIGNLRSAMPDIRYTVEDLIAERDRVASRVVLTGTHTGEPLFGVPAAGRPVRVEQYHVVRCDDQGRCLEHWGNVGAGEILRQVGGAARAGVPA